MKFPQYTSFVINHLKNETLSLLTEVPIEMCDEFICSDSGVGLCEDDRKLLENLGSKKLRKSDKPGAGPANSGSGVSDGSENVTDNNNNEEETDRNIDKHTGSH